MGDWRSEIEEALDDFGRGSEVMLLAFDGPDLEVEYLPAPHEPKALPPGRIAVYAFWGDGDWLKIGKAGERSGARFASHHYNMSAPSTLARSLAGDRRMAGVPGFDPADPGTWIRSSTCRVNILMSATRDPLYLSFLEAYLHMRLQPRYEGLRSAVQADSDGLGPRT